MVPKITIQSMLVFISADDLTKHFPQEKTVSVVEDESKKDSQDSGFSEITSTSTGK